MSRELPIDQIDMRADARAIDEASVAALVDSIGAVGLINPIRVRAVAGRWEVIAGAHRLAACKKLGLVEIESIIVDDDDLHAELAMIDENLCRAELSPADRAKQTARRKAIYLELHPETAHGSPGVSRQVGDTQDRSETERFTEATAKITGQSERAVQRDVQRGQAIVPAVLEFVTGTELDTGVYLDKLRKARSADQMTMAKRDLAAARQQARDRARGGIARRVVKVADQPLSDDEKRENWIAAGMAWFNRGNSEWFQEFLHRIDTPVFDRSAA